MLAILRRLRREESGQVTAWFVGIFVFLMIMFAFTVDFGYWLLERRHGQNDVDAAVLAGVQMLPLADPADAAQDAQDWLNQNSKERDGSEVSECGVRTSSDPTQNYDLVLDGTGAAASSGFAFADVDDDGEYDKIRACIKRDGLILFSSLLDISGVTVPAVAAAGLDMQPLRYALMAMNPDGCSPDGEKSLYLSGNPIVNLGDEGSSYTDSTCDQGLYLQGASTELNGGSHDFCGASFYQTSPDNLSGTPRDFICGVPDPWVDEEQPNPGSCVSKDVYDDLVLSEGTYCDPLDIRDDVTFQPGTYIFKQGLTMKNDNYSIAGDEVVFYFTCKDAITVCCPSGPCSNRAGAFEMNGGSIDISAPADLPHIVIWVDRTSAPQTPENKCHVYLIGNGAMSVEGHIYSWSDCVSIGGTSGGSNRSFDGTILGDKIDFSGNATYDITWSEEFAPKIAVIALVE